MTRYVRPTSTPLETDVRRSLLRDHHAHYAALARTSPEALNVKLPRAVLEPLLDEIGARLLEEAERLSREAGPVADFLDRNPLPPALEPHLPRSFRAFALILNSLKQWVAKEQAATDRFLLGGSARQACRAAAETCIVTGEALGDDAELHHPVRDGRPPILLSKAGHDRIEGQGKGDVAGGVAPTGRSGNGGAKAPGDSTVLALVLAVKRNESWKQLRRGCRDRLGHGADPATTPAVQNNAKAFASRARKATGLGYGELLAWMDENDLGL